MNTFKIGDRVKYTSAKYGDSECNPLWNGKYGRIIGTVCHTNGLPCWVNVNWSNGIKNDYEPQSLEIVNESFEIEKDFDDLISNL